jgi:hypothetical protein
MLAVRVIAVNHFAVSTLTWSPAISRISTWPLCPCGISTSKRHALPPRAERNALQAIPKQPSWSQGTKGSSQRGDTVMRYTLAILATIGLLCVLTDCGAQPGSPPGSAANASASASSQHARARNMEDDMEERLR